MQVRTARDATIRGLGALEAIAHDERVLHRRRLLLRVFLALALFLQSATPIAHARAGADGLSYLCGLPGQTASAASLRMAERLAQALNPDKGEDGEDAGSEHCPLCVFASGAPLPAIAAAPAPRLAISETTRPASRTAYVNAPRGPPVGATGPPLLI